MAFATLMELKTKEMSQKKLLAKAPPPKQPVQPLPVPPADPDETLLPDTNDPDIIPDEDEFVTPPYEEPEPGEGP